MLITFFIGNGFDINLGLNTKYSNFYPYFIENSKEENMIRKWLEEDDLLWADLEEKIGEKLEDVKQNDLNNFYEDKVELDMLLLKYLECEQEKIVTQDKEKEIADELARSLIKFYDGLSEVDRNSIKATCNTYKNEEFKYGFISFNYTDTLDRIVDITRKLISPITTHQGNGGMRNNLLDRIIHIHGTLSEEMILGVNDINQVNNSFLKEEEEFLDTFIKRRINDSIGQRKTEYAKELIEGSHIICIFGMSVGSTDKMWWEEIISWLRKNENNKLVVYYKENENELQKKIPVKIIRLNNKLKRRILERGGVSAEDSDLETLKKRIFISYNANIFNFKDCVTLTNN